jgi:hypothetical protein
MPLKIELAGARYIRDRSERAAYERQHWLRIPALLDEPLLRRIDAALSHSGFAETRHDGVGADSVDLRVVGAPVSELLVLVCNDPVVLRAVEDITGSAPLTRFSGSIYRMLPRAGHQQEWHDDLIGGRLITLSINLGTSIYSGGVLEMRHRTTGGTIAEVPNTGRGDAVLFNLDRALEHRVTPVTSGVKTAFAGWFRRGTPLRDELRRGSVQLGTS